LLLQTAAECLTGYADKCIFRERRLHLAAGRQ
jgi:hypothetical protein